VDGRRRWLALLLAAVACSPATVTVAPTVGAEPTVTAAVAPAPTEAAAAATDAPTASPQAPPQPNPLPFVPCAEVRAGATTLCTPGTPTAHLAIDNAISLGDAGAIARQVSSDLEDVQAEFGWTLRGEPVIDVYATNERYASGLRDVFGYSQVTATYLAENSVAFFEPALRRIAVSWEAVRDRRPIAAIRHELTHFVTLEACAPRCDLVPAWLNEGQARLAEALIPGADWRMMRVRYEAASMVATDTLLPLTTLWSQGQWNAIGDWAGYYKYQEAARATQLLRADIGDHAIARVYARIRAGEDVPSAYQRLSGKSWSAFIASMPARFAADIPPGPAISVISPGADGTGASYLLYGFATEAKVTLRVKARYFDLTEEITVSPQGAHFASIDTSYPPGTYTITAASGSTAAAVTVIKRGGRAVRAALPD
jgi:hypothetical protein